MGGPGTGAGCTGSTSSGAGCIGPSVSGAGCTGSTMAGCGVMGFSVVGIKPIGLLGDCKHERRALVRKKNKQNRSSSKAEQCCQT